MSEDATNGGKRIEDLVTRMEKLEDRVHNVELGKVVHVCPQEERLRSIEQRAPTAEEWRDMKSDVRTLTRAFWGVVGIVGLLQLLGILLTVAQALGKL